MFCQFFPSYLAVSLFLIIFVAMKQKIIVAIDSFKGCLTSREANEAAAVAIKGKIDHLIGLKENVIIGKLIPAGSGLEMYREFEDETDDSASDEVEYVDLSALVGKTNAL